MKHGIFMAKIAQGNGEINFNKLDFMGIKDLWINEKLWDDIWIKGEIPIDFNGCWTGSLINKLPYCEAVVRQRHWWEKVTRYRIKEALWGRKSIQYSRFLAVQSTVPEVKQNRWKTVLTSFKCLQLTFCSQALCMHHYRPASVLLLISTVCKFSTLAEVIAKSWASLIYLINVSLIRYTNRYIH